MAQPQNPQLVYVASLFTSKIFYTQVLAAAATIATAFGLHPAWLSAENQVELVGALTMLATMAFRLWGSVGPVSLTAPISTPAPQELPPGVHTITVQPPLAPVPPTTVSVVSQPLPPPAIAPLVQPPPLVNPNA